MIRCKKGTPMCNIDHSSDEIEATPAAPPEPVGEKCGHPMDKRIGLSPVDRSERCEACGAEFSDPIRQYKQGGSK